MEKKIFWKFNIVDLALIAVIIIGLAAMIYGFVKGDDKRDTETFLITYTCRSAPNEALDGIESGAECMDGDYGNSLGKLTDIRRYEIKDDSLNQQVVFVTAVNGIKSEHGVTINDVLYLKGKELNLVAADSVFSVYLSGIQELK